MASPKRPFQFTLMQLVLAVAMAAVIFSVPPILWLIGIWMTVSLNGWNGVFLHWYRVVCWGHTFFDQHLRTWRNMPLL
jgi:hypothetical protein